MGTVLGRATGNFREYDPGDESREMKRRLRVQFRNCIISGGKIETSHKVDR